MMNLGEINWDKFRALPNGSDLFLWPVTIDRNIASTVSCADLDGSVSEVRFALLELELEKGSRSSDKRSETYGAL